MCVQPVVPKIARHLHIFHDLAQGEGTPTYMYFSLQTRIVPYLFLLEHILISKYKSE